jgi:hypothetical protein
MATPNGRRRQPTYYLVPRDERGELSEFGRGIVSAVSPGGFTFGFSDRLTATEVAVLDELGGALSDAGIRLPSPNPFLVLEIEGDVSAAPGTPVCSCLCGVLGNCSGTGGGA